MSYDVVMQRIRAATCTADLRQATYDIDPAALSAEELVSVNAAFNERAEMYRFEAMVSDLLGCGCRH